MMPFDAPEHRPSVNVNVNLVKSTLPGTKSKKKNKGEKAVKKALPGKQHSKSNRRNQISLFQRVPALQVLPQRFLQDGIQIPTFVGSADSKVTSSHNVNDMVINELQRKHAIPGKSKDKQTASKRQYLNLPVQPLQTVQPILAPFASLPLPRRPQVHVQVNVARKSNVTLNKDSDKEKASTKVKRQIYGMNELPHGLEFSDDKSNSSSNKTQNKKFNINTETSNSAKDLKTVHKRNAEQPSKGTSNKTASESVKRQFVSPFDGEQGLLGTHNDEEVQHVYPGSQENQDQMLPQHVKLPYGQHFIQNEPQLPLPQHVVQGVSPVFQQAGIAEQQPLVQEPNPLFSHQPQVNVNVQVAKKSASNQPKKEESKILTKRQLFGTVPLLASPDSLSSMNAVGSERSNVPDTNASSKVKRQIVGVAQPLAMVQPALPQPYAVPSPFQPRVNINVQTSRSDIGRNKRQLYNILSGKKAQAKNTPEVSRIEFHHY